MQFRAWSSLCLWFGLAATSAGADTVEPELVGASATTRPGLTWAMSEPAQGAVLPASRFPPGADYNITLVTDRAPDFTDLQSYLNSITSQYRTSQEKAIAVWRWSQRLRKQTAYPTEDGQEVLDPILFFTSYGYTQCGIISGIDNALWLNLGWKAHYVQLGDHTVCECSWDDGKTWHMFDDSMSIYCFNDKGEVASVQEIEQNPRYYLENFAPECGTNPVKELQDHQGWRVGADRPVEYQRSLANGMDSFLPPNEIHQDHLAAQWGRRYVLNLRPGEQYTRYFKNLDAGKPDPRYYRPLRGQDVEEASQDKNIRANGVWRYAPDLRDAATRTHIYSESGVSWTTAGIKGPGSVTFKVSAANVVTSAKLSLRATRVAVSVSRDAGLRWAPVSAASGETELLEQVAGVTEYLVKVDLGGPDALLSSIAIETITQLNRAALPKLTRGANRVQLRLGQQVQTITVAPSVVAGNHRKTILAEQSVDVNPQPYFNVATLRAGAKDQPCFVTWKIEVPTPIVDVVYGGNICVKSTSDSVALLHSWDGQSFTQDFRKADGSLPYDLVVNALLSQVPADARTVYLRYQFETTDETQKWRAPGIQTALMTIHHQAPAAGFTPIEVTYCWVEHRESGDVERRHTELVTSAAHEYTIDVGGCRDPTMKWVRMNLHGYEQAGAKVKYGYSDGEDVGSSAKAPWARYRWGKNLALGRPYTLEGRQDERNPDGGGDLTDGVIAPPDTYVSAKYMPTSVMFAKDVSPVITIDLGGTQTVAAVRVHAGQEGGFHLSYPDTIAVETSTDGTTFAPAGSAGFNQVFDPPADYVPWELDDGAQFDDLPAGGRLAYAYRVIFAKPVSAHYVRVRCIGRHGWGMLLSEVQVFDKVTADKNVPPLVVLPPIAAEPSAAPQPCRIEVVEKGRGWPVPLVELRTTHQVRFVTDNAGVIAFDLPELMGRETWFDVIGHGYEVPKDGFGYRGVWLKPEPGNTLKVEVQRNIIARRVGRLTGGGLFGESQKLGQERDWRESGILGCDSVQNAVHRGRLYWLWGDTVIPNYPLGIFDGTSATTAVQPLASFQPPLRLKLDYFADENGRPRGVAKLPGNGPTWVTGYVSLPDKTGTPRLVGSYVKVTPPMDAYQWGLALWNDETRNFEPLRVVWTKSDATPKPPPLPEGHPILWKDESGKPWVLFGNPLPALRCPATFEAWQDAATWEVLKPQDSILAAGDGTPIKPHSGSIAWHPWRKRWVTVFMQSLGKPSVFGELWYAEADAPAGPWRPAVKILSHENYTFYNPRLHPEFTPDGSPMLFFEGTYTMQFSDNKQPTPRYDYNQILYRLDLDDPALLPAQRR